MTPVPLSAALLDSTVRVLLVDDSAAEAELFRVRLGAGDAPRFELHWVDNHDGGLARLLDGDVDVAVIDERPGLGPSGLDLIKRAHACGCPVPCLLATGYPIPFEDVLAAGAVDHLDKGAMTSGGLRRALAWAVERDRLRQVLEQQAQTLARSEASFRSLAQNADGMLIVGPEGGIRYANPAARGLAALRQEGLAGARYEAVLGPLGQPGETHEAAAHDPARQLEARFCRVDWHGEPATLVTLRDVTELRRARAMVLHQSRMSVVGRLAGSMAHNLNNLMTGIVGHIDIALGRVGDLPGAARQLERALDLAERVTQMTRSIGAYTRKRAAPDHTVSLDEVVSEVLPSLQMIAGEEAPITATLSGTPAHVRLSRAEIEHALTALVANSRDAAQGRCAITITSGVRQVTADELHDTVGPPLGALSGLYGSVTVADDGPGMSPDTLARAFEPFFTTKPTDKGVGLGLATVAALMRQAGGALLAHSEEGRGTTVELLAPLEAEAIRPSPPPPAAPFSPLPIGRDLILLVDDERAIRTSVCSALTAAGHQVVTASDGVEALRRFHTDGHRVALLLTDVALPGLDGFELADAARALRPELPVLFMSGYADDVVRSRGLDPAQVQVLAKPFRLAQVAAAVARVLGDASAGG